MNHQITSHRIAKPIIEDGNERKSWCIKDEHALFEFYEDFNEWLEGDEAIDVREQYNLLGLSSPSKAFFAGDKEAYMEVFTEYRALQKNEALSESYLTVLRTDMHWFYQNLKRFEQFIECFGSGAIVPFIGAGVSATAGFPTWKEHLIGQGITAGMKEESVQDLLSTGKYEEVVNNIESVLSREVFIQEVKDSFLGSAKLSDLLMRITELFSNKIITTNYDSSIEQAFTTRFGKSIETLSHSNWLPALSNNKTSIIKIHGSITDASNCILSKSQYDTAYGVDGINMKLPIPKLLSYFYKTYPLLFIGCSLNNDRTMKVFKYVKDKLGDKIRPQHFSIEQAPETELEMVSRNAFLLDHGITAIWFEHGSYDLVESILRHLRNEMRYRNGGEINQEKTSKPLHSLKNSQINSLESIFTTIKSLIFVSRK